MQRQTAADVIRLVSLASLAAIGFAGGAAASSTVYGPTGTAACMRATGASVARAPGIVSATFPEIRSAIYWRFSPATTITIMFTPNASDAGELAQDLRLATYSIGLTRAQVKSTVRRLGNAVWTNNGFPGPTLEQNALIGRCLH